jgi:hypothetical protein
MRRIKMKEIANKYFFVPIQKEYVDTCQLVKLIEEDKWIDSDTVIVSCAPLYSSRITQIVNHKLSYLNRNELYESVDMEMPYPNMNQVWSTPTASYQLFDKYLKDWIRTNVSKSMKYLFVSSSTLRGKNFSKVRMSIAPHMEPSQCRFASVYRQADSIFVPDYCVEVFDKKSQGGLLFEWENSDNPNWDY